MNSLRGEQRLLGNSRGSIVKSVSGVILGCSLLAGCSSSEQSSSGGGFLSSPSWNIGHHIVNITLACNNKPGGLNQAIITGPTGEAWGANVIDGRDNLGVGVSENPKNQFTAGRDRLEADTSYTNYGSPNHDGTIDDYSEQIDLKSGPGSNQVTATCFDSSRHLQPHGAAKAVAVP